MAPATPTIYDPGWDNGLLMCTQNLTTFHYLKLYWNMSTFYIFINKLLLLIQAAVRNWIQFAELYAYIDGKISEEI